MIKYAVEEMSDSLVNELKVVLQDHWEEIAMYRDKIKFSPDYNRYWEAANHGCLHIVTVRDDEEIIGYFISFISPHVHYQNDRFAVNDILYIKKEYRGTTVAYRMFKFAEKELKKAGASVFIVSMKADFPFERLCESLGMSKHEITYSKYLGD